MSKFERFLTTGHPKTVIDHLGKMNDHSKVALAFGHMDHDVFIAALLRLKQLGALQQHSDDLLKSSIISKVSHPDRPLIASRLFLEMGDKETAAIHLEKAVNLLGQTVRGSTFDKIQSIASDLGPHTTPAVSAFLEKYKKTFKK
ncbi:MAG TPA: hypothetical protein VGQ00_00255 [Candidatus Norongarragalinales archaeon]|jgi:hypothetical protein|nr:hypothetical protein [Candidatus Norongarragalinales archaeon]